MSTPLNANQRRSLDLVCDALVNNRRFSILCVIDDFRRERLAAVVDDSLSGERAARDLDPIAERRGSPCMMVSDNGTVLTSNAMLAWPEGGDADWRRAPPDEPTQNGFVESFDGRLRDPRLSERLFRGLRRARENTDDWRMDYNLRRPHRSLNGLTPNECATRSETDHNANKANR